MKKIIMKKKIEMKMYKKLKIKKDIEKLYIYIYLSLFIDLKFINYQLFKEEYISKFKYLFKIIILLKH